MNKQELNDKLLSVIQKGDLDTIKYLLSSPDLKEHSNINYKDEDDENILTWAVSKGHLEVAKYLIVDMNMDVDKSTMEWLEKKYQKEIYENVLKLIKSRDLYQELDKSIRDDKINNKKVKL